MFTRKLFVVCLFFACVSALKASSAHAVQVYPDSNQVDPCNGTTNFYIFNNTKANITSGGSGTDFGFALPGVDSYYAASLVDVAVHDLSLDSGTEVYTIKDPSGNTYTFGIFGYTNDSPLAQSAQWRLVTNRDPSWNQTNGQSSASGAYTIIDQSGSVEQMWNDNYVVTLMFNPQGNGGDKSLSCFAWIILVINPNTTAASFFQSGIQNDHGTEWNNQNN